MDHVHSIPRLFSHFLNVITGRTALVEPAFFRRFCQNWLLDRQAFNFCGYHSNIFLFTEQSSALRATPNLEDQISVFMSPQ
jgi:hypothetical protein